MRAAAFTVALVVGSSACAGLLDFIAAAGPAAVSIVDAVLECVPLGDEPPPDEAAACLDATLGAVEHVAGQGECVINCAVAVRSARRLRASGDDATEAEARALALIEQLRTGEEP